MVGYKVTRANGRIEYVYFNPSGTSDDDQNTVFVYAGLHGNVDKDTPVVYVNVFDTEDK